MGEPKEKVYENIKVKINTVAQGEKSYKLTYITEKGTTRNLNAYPDIGELIKPGGEYEFKVYLSEPYPIGNGKTAVSRWIEDILPVNGAISINTPQDTPKQPLNTTDELYLSNLANNTYPIKESRIRGLECACRFTAGSNISEEALKGLAENLAKWIEG